MSIILQFLNLAFFLLAVITLKEKNILILGGAFPLIIVIALLVLLSSLFSKHRLELQSITTIIFGIIGLQYVSYYETMKLIDYEMTLNLSMAIDIIIYILLIYIYAKAILPIDKQNDADTHKNKRIIAKTILLRFYLYCFAGGVFTWLVGTAIQIYNQDYLIRHNILFRRNILSFVPIVIFTLILSNITIYFAMRKIDDKYFYYLYQKKNINLPKITKIVIIFLGIFFLVSCIFEILTRDRILLCIENYLFILSIYLILSRIYKFEVSNINKIEVTNIDLIAIDEIKVDYVFYLKYIVILTITYSLFFILFLSFWKWINH